MRVVVPADCVNVPAPSYPDVDVAGGVVEDGGAADVAHEVGAGAFRRAADEERGAAADVGHVDGAAFVAEGAGAAGEHDADVSAGDVDRQRVARIYTNGIASRSADRRAVKCQICSLRRRPCDVRLAQQRFHFRERHLDRIEVPVSTAAAAARTHRPTRPAHPPCSSGAPAGCPSPPPARARASAPGIRRRMRGTCRCRLRRRTCQSHSLNGVDCAAICRGYFAPVACSAPKLKVGAPRFLGVTGRRSWSRSRDVSCGDSTLS